MTVLRSTMPNFFVVSDESEAQQLRCVYDKDQYNRRWKCLTELTKNKISLIFIILRFYATDQKKACMLYSAICKTSYIKCKYGLEKDSVRLRFKSLFNTKHCSNHLYPAAKQHRTHCMTVRPRGHNCALPELHYHGATNSFINRSLDDRYVTALVFYFIFN